MTIQIITDTSCNVSDRVAQKFNILRVPAWINFADGTTLRNGVDISDEEFYRRLTTEKKLPTTSQPTPQDFIDAIADTTADDVIIATVSSLLSGTHNSAVQAAALTPERRIHVYDTLSASVGSAWQIIAGAEAVAAGGDVAATLAAMEQTRERTETVFTIDTLKYLAASGRAPALQAMLGSLLDIKPQLRIEDGKLEVSGRARGRKRSMRELAERAAAWADGQTVRVAVASANVPDEAAALAAMLSEEIKLGEAIETVELGPVLGAIAGPGTLAIATLKP